MLQARCKTNFIFVEAISRNYPKLIAKNSYLVSSETFTYSSHDLFIVR